MARPFKNGDVDSGPRLPKGAGWMSGEGTLARRSVMLEALLPGGVISAVFIIFDLRLMCSLRWFPSWQLAIGKSKIVYAGVAQQGGGASLRN